MCLPLYLRGNRHLGMPRRFRDPRRNQVTPGNVHIISHQRRDYAFLEAGRRVFKTLPSTPFIFGSCAGAAGAARRCRLTVKLNVRLINAMSRATAKSGKPAGRRRPGRPGGVAHTRAIRAELLKAARELFARRDFKAASVREIAAAARVNPAMIHYHFGDKDGLYRAMLQETIGPVLQKVQELMDHGSLQTEKSLRDALEAVMTMLAREPWVARLIVREVLAEEGPFRDLFIREFAAKGGGRVPQLLKREIANGRVRKDLDPTLGALSFMSMALFPFIALPVVQKVFRIKMSAAFVARLIGHTEQLFYQGAAPRRKPFPSAPD